MLEKTRSTSGGEGVNMSNKRKKEDLRGGEGGHIYRRIKGRRTGADEWKKGKEHGDKVEKQADCRLNEEKTKEVMREMTGKEERRQMKGVKDFGDKDGGQGAGERSRKLKANQKKEERN